MAALFLGLAPFLLAEAGLRLAGAGHAEPQPDTYLSFAASRPLFRLDASGRRYEIPAERQPFFKPDGFAAKKAPREFRIFCFGGSTVQGNPYSIETSFTTWLELTLQAADASREWQVVNCGGISYASYRLAPIVRECLQYQPDLFIICTGHNEFLEDRSYGHLKRLPAWLARLHELLSNVRLFNVVHRGWRKLVGESESEASPSVLAAEVEALLDYRGGLEWYHRDDEWRYGVEEHFRHTLQEMITDSVSAGVPVLLIDPVCNLKDCPPFKVEVYAQLPREACRRLEELLAGAGQESGGASAGLDNLQEAVRIDPRHAGAWYLLGTALLAAGEEAEAKQAFQRARDEDICPLRATGPLHAAIHEIGQDLGVPVVPVQRLFEERSPHGIPGDEWLLDHVHPSISGHQLIADLLLETMAAEGLVQPAEGWQDRQQELFRSHFATLDTPYFARGQEHLDGLRKWAHGRVTKIRGK